MKRVTARLAVGAAAAALCAVAFATTGITGGDQPSSPTVQIAALTKVGAAPATTASSGAAPKAAATDVPPVQWRGINISGGEFAGGGAPGKLNYQYTYPTKAEIDYYDSLGFNLIRVPFMWERLQPTLNGALSAVDRQELRNVVDYATGKGMVVVLDMHNYARRATGTDYKTVSMIGSPAVSTATFSKGWIRIAGEYRGNGRVWIGLMNEPYGIEADAWWAIAQQTVKDLRANGINNMVVVPGTSWTGAHSWYASGNAAAAETYADPIKRSIFDIHQYLDPNSSGTSNKCAVGSGARVQDVIDWAKARKVKLFLGEMGATNVDPQCDVEYPDMLDRIEQSGVFTGWAAWGGGTWWIPSYPFRTLTSKFPDVSETSPHMDYLLPYVTPES